MLDVNRKARKNIPIGGIVAEIRLGNLVGKFQLAVGYIGIHHRKYQDHDAPGKAPEMQLAQRILHLGRMPHNGVRQPDFECHLINKNMMVIRRIIGVKRL